ncbi:MAG: hypothetical protein IPP68_02575 [Elusimicrobia bacterium]|nr:hypothetical protein [Elusimicrobiota bacterium]
MRIHRRWGRRAALAGAMALAGMPLRALTLNTNGVLPRLFSPNGDGINDVVYFSLSNPALSDVTGRVLDVSGGEVSDLAPAGAFGPTPESLMWDGRDRSGRVVPSGPYLFEIQGDGQWIRGVVVVVL